MKYGIKIVLILILIIIAMLFIFKLQNRTVDVYKPASTVNTSSPSISLSLTPTVTPEPNVKLPKGFVYVTDVIPTARLDIRYYSDYNFVGERIDGYKAPKAILTIEAANALKNACDSLKAKGYTIVVYDAYRPDKAVKHFVRWAQDLEDDKMKDIFYPSLNKSELLNNYISIRSNHSKGSVIDLSLIDNNGNEVDMGGYFDLFDKQSWHDTDKINEIQKKNRKILKEAMESAGFIPSAAEWWHYRLSDEPYPDTFFDFDIE